MKHRVWYIVFSAMVLTCYSNSADAQFLKKLFGGGRKKTKNEFTKRSSDEKVNKPSEDKPVLKKRELEYPPGQIKDRYRIDLLAPLYLEELVKDGKAVFKYRLPDKAFDGVTFYEGMTLAADTLRKLGYKFDIYVHDVTDILESPSTLVNTDAFINSDLIIGVMSAQDIPQVARYAAKHHINFVSALSPSDGGVMNNPFFTMLQPTLYTHCKEMTERMYKKYKNTSPIVFYRTNVTVDSLAYEYIMDNNRTGYNVLLCNEIPSGTKILPLLDSTTTNIVLMPILSEQYAESLILKLKEWFPNYRFDIWGMPSWDDLPSMKKPDSYPNTTIYYTSPYYFDSTTASGRALVRKYKKQYGGRPDPMVFRGYETLYWYGYLLRKYGTVFNPYMKDNGWAPFTRYDIRTNWTDKNILLYNENKHLYLYKYSSGSYLVEY